MWSYKDHGKNYEAVYERQHPPGFRWLHESFGTNWRMLEMQAVIGRIQLKRMPEWHARRTANARAILSACQEFGVLRAPSLLADDGSVHAQYKCYVYVRREMLKSGWNRDRMTEAIQAAGVPCYQGTCSEVYLEKAFDKTGWRPALSLTTAKKLGEESLSFLVHPTLSEAEIQKNCTVIKQVMMQAQN